MNRLKYPHRLYLPNSIASYLCVHFRIMPGSLISEALRALATRVVVANSDLVPPPVEQEEGVEGVEVQQEQAPPVRTSFPTDDKIRPSILCSIPQSIALIESEVKLLCKSNEEYEALTGLERLQLWTNAQPKHLFIG